MTVTYHFELLEEPPPPLPPTDTGASELSPIEDRTLFGVGLLTPFRRDGGSDFVSGSGVELVKSAISQVLGVRADDGRMVGELPWRPEFGSLLYRLQYAGMDETFAALLRHRVLAAIEQWEPRARITQVTVSRTRSATGDLMALVRVQFNVVQAGTDNVLFRNAQVDVPLST